MSAPGYYPVALDLRDRPCLVVGGGAVAEAKVRALVAAGARVMVVSPALTEGLASLVAVGEVRHERRPYRSSDIEGYALAFAATDDREVTRRVADDARRHGVWLNAADDPAFCDFILPAVLRRGRLTVAVSTGGASPALASWIRRELEARFGEAYAGLVEVVAAVRAEVRCEPAPPSADTWRRALDAVDLPALIETGRSTEAAVRLRRALREVGAARD